MTAVQKKAVLGTYQRVVMRWRGRGISPNVLDIGNDFGVQKVNATQRAHMAQTMINAVAAVSAATLSIAIVEKIHNLYHLLSGLANQSQPILQLQQLLLVLQLHLLLLPEQRRHRLLQLV